MNIQLVIPMAGIGSRFANEGYQKIKPLLEIGSYSMIEVVLQNLDSASVESITIVTRSEISENYSLQSLLEKKHPKVNVITLNAITNGPATTVSHAFDAIDLNSPIIIANSDQYVDIDFEKEFQDFLSSGLEGFIWGMEDDDPKWSYVALDEEGLALKVAEKKVISKIATCGIYAFSSGYLFQEGYKEMIACADTTNGEYYVAPIYNYLIKRGCRIGVSNLGLTSQIMHGLGTPEDYKAFLRSPISKRFA